MKKRIIGTTLAVFSFLFTGTALAAYDFGPMIAKTNAGEIRITEQRAYLSDEVMYAEGEGYDTTEAESMYAEAEVSYGELQSDIDEFQGMLEDATEAGVATPSAELKAKRTELAEAHASWKAMMLGVYAELESLYAEAA